MKKIIIVAKSLNNVIGKDNQLVWHLPADMKFFKETTKGHHVVMGRKTFESLGKPLPNRTNFVITRNKDYKPGGVTIVHSLSESFKLAENQGAEKLFILGGGEIYRQAISVIDTMIITEVKATVEGDTFFPSYDPTEWEEVSRVEHPTDERHAYPFAFITLEHK